MPRSTACAVGGARRPRPAAGGVEPPPLGRMQLSTLLSASGSHPRSLARIAGKGGRRRRPAAAIDRLGPGIRRSAKDEKLLELLAQSRGEKVLIFANFRRTLEHLQRLLDEAGIAYRHLLRRRVGPAEGRGGRGLPAAGAGHALLRVAAARAATSSSPTP